jgi:hypothetical protein
MHYPPFDKLVLVAEQCPMSMGSWLHCWREIYENNGNPLQREVDDSLECRDLLEDLEELEAWDLISYDYIDQKTIEISLPLERNGFYLDL